ncbi:hypothetical protein V6B08_00380 [Ferrovibrio sp. MS7]|uniref:DUF1127 domain-containing protein n=1 Tax=Ferrovibrio plantarum TaxID=3119164 RepID=UPI003134F552
MTYQPNRQQIAAVKKHERSVLRQWERELDLSWLSGAEFPSLAALGLPWWQLLPLAAYTQFRIWRERVAARQRLADLGRGALHDLGIDPGQAAFEAEQPFWRPHLLQRARDNA